MNPKSMEDKLSIDLDAYLNGVEHKDKLTSQEYSELLELGKNLIDKDFSKSSNKQAVFHQALKNINQYKGAVSVKKTNKIRRPIIAAASLAVICLMTISLIQPSFAHNLVEKVIKTISLGHIQVTQYDPEEESLSVPEELKGKIFDEDGNSIEVFSREYTGKIYTVDGEEILDFANWEIITASNYENYKKDTQEEVLEIKDSSQLNNYTCFNVILPSYLPDGYQFDKAEFYKDENGVVNNSKYISLYFTHKETGKYIYMQQRFADEETAYATGTDGKVEEIKINGVDAVLSDDRSIDWEANNTLYGLHGRGEISKSELIKIAESIK